MAELMSATVARPDGEDAPGAVAPPADRWPRGARRLLLPGLLVVLAVPVVVALVVLRNPRWFPILDLAWTELRVRDVGGRDTPLVGLAGRFHAFDARGSHPGPLSFWALAPLYRLFGGGAAALQAAAVALHLVAIGGILWIGQRRFGARGALALAAVVAVLAHLYGSAVLTEAWNPYLPVLWWLLFLLAAWSVLCKDLAMLPVAVFAGSFAAQTHISYTPLVLAVGAAVVVAGVVWALRQRHDRAALSPLVRWGTASAVLLVLLWLPSLVDQVANRPGNASLIVEHFRTSPEEPAGAGLAARVLGLHLNPWRLLSGDTPPAIITRDTATIAGMLPGLALLGAWLASVVAAWRLRHAALLRLHGLLAVALVVGAVSLSRILGVVWFYLVLWAWAVTALLLVAVGWTLAAWLARRRPAAVTVLARTSPRRRALAGAGASGTVLLAWTALFTFGDAARAEVPDEPRSRQLGELAAPTVAALEAREAESDGDQRYLVTWADPGALGATGFGLLLELERAGFDVGAPELVAAEVGRHRTLAEEEATARVHLSVGPDVDVWRELTGDEPVALSDVRTASQRDRAAALRDGIVERLDTLGLDDLVPEADTASMFLRADPRIDEEVRRLVAELDRLPLPSAVFVTPLD